MTINRKQQLITTADILFNARINTSPIDQLPNELRPADIDESYQLQDYLNRKLCAADAGKVIGYKIGCTTKVMQEYLAIPHPCSGAIFENSVCFGDGTFSAERLCRPGVECEIAVQLSNDMPDGQLYTATCCDAHVRSAMCSIELVDDRWTDYERVNTYSMIAENFFGAGCVFGEPSKTTASELKDIKGTMRINGVHAGSGCGSDILGHPYEALAWLANHQVMRGLPLKAGDYVSLGSVVKTHWLNTGDTVDIEFTGLGGCSLTLEA